MAGWLQKKFSFLKKYWLVATALVVYIFITIPAVFDANHFLYNLEPYPDGLLHVLSGRNLVLGRGFQLVYFQETVAVWTAPLYPLFLSLSNLFSTKIVVFYVANIAFHLASLSLLFLILKKTVSNAWIKVLALAVYFSHLVLFWLPTVPMAENLSLLLFSLLIYSYFEVNQKRRFTLLMMALAGLLLTRYAAIGVVLGGVVTAIMIWRKKEKKLPLFLWLFPLVLIIFFEIFLRSEGRSGWRVMGYLINGNNPYFNLQFAWNNLVLYSKMFLFGTGAFLWQNVGISSGILTCLYLFACGFLYKKREFTKATILTVLFLSQLPLQLIFYVADARYLIYSIPLITLGIAWLLEAWSEKRRLLVPLVVLGLVVQLFTQRALIKEVIANNWLGRSTAWQYEAILHFNKTLLNEDRIITALPPFLVDAYQTKTYRALPLAYSQEFFRRSPSVWGDDLNYENLTASYQAWLEEGRELYISNAYITHQQSVIQEYENYKQNFNFELVSAGCEQACNVYKLSLKE